MLLTDMQPAFSYGVLYSIFEASRTVLRIRLVNDDDSSSNQCYVTFASAGKARSAFEAVHILPIIGAKT